MSTEKLKEKIIAAAAEQGMPFENDAELAFVSWLAQGVHDASAPSLDDTADLTSLREQLVLITFPGARAVVEAEIARQEALLGSSAASRQLAHVRRLEKLAPLAFIANGRPTRTVKKVEAVAPAQDEK